MEVKGERDYSEIAKAQFLLLMMTSSAKARNIGLWFCGCMEDNNLGGEHMKFEEMEEER